MAERHVSEGERHVVQQEELISRLKLEGLPTSEAEQLLKMFQALLIDHRKHRDLIAAELGGEAG